MWRRRWRVREWRWREGDVLGEGEGRVGGGEGNDEKGRGMI